MTSGQDRIPASEPFLANPEEWRKTTSSLRRLARSIVGEEALSEDIVQSAWVTALERDEHGTGIGWLRRLVRSRAIDVVRRRARKPSAEDRTGEVPRSAADELAVQFELQRLVLDAVEELNEPYRSTVFLRYFDDVGPEEIARRMGVPLKTVKTRLTRAHALLRTRLARHYEDSGDARAWIAFALHGSSSALEAPWWSVPTIAAAAMNKFTLVLLTVVALFTGWIVLGNRPDDPASPTSQTETARANSVTPLANASAPDDASSERKEVAEPASPAPPPAPLTIPLETGSLRVTVLWHDGSLASDVHVIVSEQRGYRVGQRRFRRGTDEEGVAFFPELPPGSFTVQVDRASNLQLTAVLVEVDETSEATVSLPDGFDVVGTVVDIDGTPVPDAGIWLTSMTGRWTSGAIVTRSDDEGRFELRDLSGGPSLGALAKGYLPSPLVDLDVLDQTQSPLVAELVVAAGGASLSGTVTNGTGQPVPDATVAVGRYNGRLQMRLDHTVGEVWTPQTARTDAEGRFTIESLEPGEVTMRVRRFGLPQWSGAVLLVNGQRTTQNVVLRPGATVTGIVRDADGRPLPGAVIHGFDEPLSEAYLQHGQIDYDGAFAQLATTADESGRYRLRAVSPRTMYLYALEPPPSPEPLNAPGATASRKRPLVRYAKTRLELTPGETVIWDPVLTDGRVIEGRATYRDGTPIKGVFVSVTDTTSGEDHRASRTETGEFRFLQLSEAAYDVRVQMFDLPKGEEEPAAYGVVPDGGPIEIVAAFDAPVEFDDATVRIRFRDVGKRVGPGEEVTVLLEWADRHSWRFGESNGDVWTFSIDEPSSFRPLAVVRDRVIAVGEVFEVDRGGLLDLGTLESQPGGTLVVRLARSKETPPTGLRGFVRFDAFRRAAEIAPGVDSALRLEGLEPGPGRISFLGDNIQQVEVPFELHAGETTELDVSLVPAVPVLYHIAWNAADKPGSMGIRFYDRTTGDLADHFDIPKSSGYKSPITWNAYLPLGSYTFEVVLGDGRSHREDFEVTSLDASTAPKPKANFR